MTDLGTEVAGDAEYGDSHNMAIVVKFAQCFVETCRSQGIPPRLARCFNFGSLPKEKEVTKTPVKKRKYKPKRNPKIEALKKKKNEHKSKFQELNKTLQTEMMMVKATNILNIIENDIKTLENVLASMEKKNIQMDKNGKERVAVISREFEKIKNNIDQNEMEKQNIQMGSKSTELAEIEKKIKVMERTEHEMTTDFDRKIQELKDREDAQKIKMEKDNEERLKNLNREKEESEERIRDMQLNMTERQRAYDDEIKNLKEKGAQQELEMQNTLEKNEKELQYIQQIEAEKQRQIKAEIQKIYQKKDDIAKNIAGLENTLAINKADLESMHQLETEKKNENELVIQKIKAQKKENIENNKKRKKFALNEEGVSIGGTSSVLPRDFHFSRPGISSDIGPIDLTDEETDLPSNSANNASGRWPRWWQPSRSDRV